MSAGPDHEGQPGAQPHALRPMDGWSSGAPPAADPCGPCLAGTGLDRRTAEVRPPSRRSFLAKGLAVALVVVIGGVGVIGLLGSGSTPRSSVPVAAGPTYDPRSTTDPGPIPRLTQTDCRFAAPSWRTIECHDLHVLQDRDDPSLGTIRLHLARFASSAAQPRPEPVLFLTGGPGGTALLDFEDYTFFPFLQQHDLIVLDQRGTGRSLPSLDCPEFDGTGPADVWSLFDSMAGVRSCRDRLVDGGVSLASYSSAESAADVAELRVAMDIDEWDLYGISYGTRLALTVMRDHPEGIRSVVLDAPYPLQADLYSQGARNAQRAFDLLFDACEAQVDCQEAHQGLEDRFYDHVRHLDVLPFTLDSDDGSSWDVDGRTLIEYLFDQLYVTPAIPTLPQTIDGFIHGRYDPLVPWLEVEASGLPAGGQDFAEGQYLSVQCAEELAFFDPDAWDAATTGLTAEVIDAFEPSGLQAECRAWDVPPAAPIEDQPVVSDIPTLLLSGELDPVTAPAWADDAATSLSRSTVLHVPRSGHGVVGESRCVDQMTMAFLADPTSAVDETCLSGFKAPRFEP